MLTWEVPRKWMKNNSHSRIIRGRKDRNIEGCDLVTLDVENILIDHITHKTAIYYSSILVVYFEKVQIESDEIWELFMMVKDDDGIPSVGVTGIAPEISLFEVIEKFKKHGVKVDEKNIVDW